MNVKFKHGLSTNLDSLPIEDGTLIITTDDNSLYFDINNTRTKIGGQEKTMIAKLVYSTTMDGFYNTTTITIPVEYDYIEIEKNLYNDKLRQRKSLIRQKWLWLF